MEEAENRINNLRRLAEKRGRNALAELTGISYIAHMISPNPTRPITEKNARRIEEALNLPNRWLDESHPVNEKIPGYADYSVTEMIPITEEHFTLIPIIDIALSEKNGKIIHSTNQEDKIYIPMKLMHEKGAVRDECFELEMMDDYMMPTFKRGEYLMIDQSKNHIENNKVYAIWLNGKISIRRIAMVNEEVKIMVDNMYYKTEWPDQIIIPESLCIIGQALLRTGSI